jgi:WD40 repeat protein
MKYAQHRVRRGYAVATAVFCGLLVTACGGGDDASRAPASSAEPMAATSGTEQPQGLRKVLRRFLKKGVTAVALAPDGSAVAVARADGKVRLFDPDSVLDVSKFNLDIGSLATGVMFSRDGRWLGVVGRDSVVHIFDRATGRVVYALQGHEHAIRAIALSPDGSFIATVGEETRVMVWRAATGKLEKILGGHTGFVNAVAFSPDGTLLASADAAARILVWEVASGKLVYTLRGHADEINTVAFHPGGKLLASASADGQVLLWDLAQGVRTLALSGHKAGVRSVTFNIDGSVLASGDEDGQILVWNAATGQLDKQLSATSAAVNALVFHPKNKNVLFSGNDDYRLVRWNVASGKGIEALVAQDLGVVGAEVRVARGEHQDRAARALGRVGGQRRARPRQQRQQPAQ